MSIFGDLCNPARTSSDPEIVKLGVCCDEEIRAIRDFARDMVTALSAQATAIVTSTSRLVESFRSEVRSWIDRSIFQSRQELISVRDSISAQTAIAYSELILQLQGMGLPVVNRYGDTTNVTNEQRTGNVQNTTNISSIVSMAGQPTTGNGAANGGTTNATSGVTGAIGANPPGQFPGQMASGGTTNGENHGSPGGSNQGLVQAGTVPGNNVGSLPVPPVAPGASNGTLASGNELATMSQGPAGTVLGIGGIGGLSFAGPVVNANALSLAEATGGQVSSQSLSNAVQGALTAILQAAGNTCQLFASAQPGGGTVSTQTVSLPQFLNTVGLTANQLCQLPEQQQSQVLNGYGQVLQGITDQQKGNDFPVDLNQPLAWQFWAPADSPWRRQAARWIGGDSEQLLFPPTLQQGGQALDSLFVPLDLWDQ